MQQDNSEQVIIDPHLIAKHYIRTWFFLDLISSIPLDYVFLVVNSLTGTGVRAIRKYKNSDIYVCNLNYTFKNIIIISL